MHNHLSFTVHTQPFHGFVHTWNDFSFINGGLEMSTCESLASCKSTNVIPCDGIPALYLHTTILHFVGVNKVQDVVHQQASAFLFRSLDDDDFDLVLDIRSWRYTLIETFFAVSKFSRDRQK